MKRGRDKTIVLKHPPKTALI